jgi:hypothetical protein
MKWLISAALVLATPLLAHGQWGGQFQSQRSFSFGGGGFRRDRPVIVYLVVQPQPFTTLPYGFDRPSFGGFNGSYQFNGSFGSQFGGTPFGGGSL